MNFVTKFFDMYMRNWQSSIPWNCNYYIFIKIKPMSEINNYFYVRKLPKIGQIWDFFKMRNFTTIFLFRGNAKDAACVSLTWTRTWVEWGLLVQYLTYESNLGAQVTKACPTSSGMASYFSKAVEEGENM